MLPPGTLRIPPPVFVAVKIFAAELWVLIFVPSRQRDFITIPVPWSICSRQKQGRPQLLCTHFVSISAALLLLHGCAHLQGTGGVGIETALLCIFYT